MSLLHAVITLRIDPFIHVGPVKLAWHGLTIALGIVLGALVAARRLRAGGLDPDPLYTFGVLAAIGGLIGGRIFYLLEHGGPVLGTNGFTFDGGLILAGLLIAIYVWRSRLSLRYLDAAALGLPFGVAIGRIGDVINGEHYGARSDSFLAVRNAHPAASTPNPDFAYQNGGLYEVLLGLLVFAVVWLLRDHMRHALDLMWLVLALFAVGRFAEFFLRADSPDLALGLNNAQWTSIALLIAVGGGWMASRKYAGRSHPPRSGGGSVQKATHP